MVYDEDPYRRRPGISTARQNDGRGVSGWRKIWANGPPNEGHRMFVEGMPFTLWSYNCMVFPNLGLSGICRLKARTTQWGRLKGYQK